MSKAGRLILAACIFLCFFLVLFLFDPFAPYINHLKLNALQAELNIAKAKWDSRNIENYSYQIQYWAPLWGGCSAKITVRQGKIIAVIETRHGGFDKLPTPITLQPDQWSHDNCYYSNFTIPEVFDQLQTTIKKDTVSLDVVFDQEFGFVNQYHGSPNVGHGLLTTYITDSEFLYEFSNFQNLDVSVP